MESVLIVRIVVAAFFVIAAIVALKTAQSRTKLIKAHAGGMHNAFGGESHISYSKAIERIIDKDSRKKLSLKNYFLIEIEGNCMSNIGIEDGDIALVKKIADNNIKTEIKPFDVVLIKVQNENKKDIYKIRIVEEILNDNELKTFYFEEKNKILYKKYSSNNHSFSQVQGVLSYKKAVA